VDRYTRHELKQDDFQEALEKLQEFGGKYYRQIIVVCAAVIVIGGLAFGLRTYSEQKEAAANAAFEAALTTFDAYVGNASMASLASTGPSFPTTQAKYQKALGEFLAVARKYPRSKAGEYALIHAGICQSQLGEDSAAVKTLTEAEGNSDPEVASLAKLSLAQVLVRSGKTEEAAKIDQSLADHPTVNVPKATALMALAGLYRSKQPARARQIYLQLQNEFGSDPVLASAIKQDMQGLSE
jgi:predicted negative regulator of RcsB-dependent stress response